MAKYIQGQSGNPLGAAAHDKRRKRLKKLTTDEFEMIVNGILLADPVNLNNLTKENPSSLKTWVASIVAQGIKKGDSQSLFMLMDRLIGKVTDRLKVTSVSENKTELKIVTLPSNGFESPKNE